MAQELSGTLVNGFACLVSNREEQPVFPRSKLAHLINIYLVSFVCFLVHQNLMEGIQITDWSVLGQTA